MVNFDKEVRIINDNIGDNEKNKILLFFKNYCCNIITAIYIDIIRIDDCPSSFCALLTCADKEITYRIVFCFFNSNEKMASAKLQNPSKFYFGNKPMKHKDFLICFNREEELCCWEKANNRYWKYTANKFIERFFPKTLKFASIESPNEHFRKHDNDIEHIYNAIHNINEEEWYTPQQENIFKKIIESIQNENQYKYLWIKGPAGSGKTLTAYRIFGHLTGLNANTTVMSNHTWLILNNAYMWYQIHKQSKDNPYYIPAANTTSYGASKYVNENLCNEQFCFNGINCYGPKDLFNNARIRYWTHNIIANCLLMSETKYLIIDECQRIGKIGISFDKFISLLNKFEDKIIFLGDENQRLYSHDCDFVRDIWNKLDQEHKWIYTLNKPIRCPKSITEWAGQICHNPSPIIPIDITGEYPIICSANLDDLKKWNYDLNLPIFCLPSFWKIGNKSIKTDNRRANTINIPIENRRSFVLLGNRDWDKYDVYTLNHQDTSKPWAIYKNRTHLLFNVNDIISRTTDSLIIYVDKDFFPNMFIPLKISIDEDLYCFLNNFFYVLLTRAQFKLYLFFETNEDSDKFKKTFNSNINIDKYYYIIKGYINIERNLRRLVPNWLSIVNDKIRFMNDYLFTQKIISKELNDNLHKVRLQSNILKHEDKLTEEFMHNAISEDCINSIINDLSKI